MDADQKKVKEIARLLNSANHLEVEHESRVVAQENLSDTKEREEEYRKEDFLSKLDALDEEHEPKPEKEESIFKEREEEYTKESFLSKIDSLDEEVIEEIEKEYAKKDPLDSVLRRVEKIENSLHQIKAKINDDGEHQEGISSVQIEKIIAEKIDEAIESFKKEMKAEEKKRFPLYSQYKEDFANKNKDTVENPDEFIILGKKEDETDEEEREEEENYEYEDGLINLDSKKEKKKSSILKTLLLVVFSTFLILLVIIVGYWYIAKNNKSSDAIEKISYQPKSESAPKPLSAMISEDMIVKSKPETNTISKTSPAEVSKISLPTAENSKLVEAKTQSMPSYETRTEKSPIEKELLGSFEKKDIAFACRLKAKYPAGDYVYYLKNGSLYTPNPASDTVEIMEQNVIYNYSPDSEFVKVSEGKYLKSKIFTQCSSIQAR